MCAAEGAGYVCRRAGLEHGNGGWLPGEVARVHEIGGLGRAPELGQEQRGCLFKIGAPRTGLAAGMLPLNETSLVWYVQFDTHRYGVPGPDGPLPFLDRLPAPYPTRLRNLITSAERGPAHPWRPLDPDPPPLPVHAALCYCGR